MTRTGKPSCPHIYTPAVWARRVRRRLQGVRHKLSRVPVEYVRLCCQAIRRRCHEEVLKAFL
ncbi:unnamed protein product, partial [Ectocarpus sp. 8 AP-2014]